VVSTVLAQMTQVNHAEIGSLLTPFNRNVVNQAPGLLSADPTTLAQISGEVTRQAAMIGYLDDFRLMMVVCLIAMPIILLLRSPNHQAAGGASEQVVME
jgi:DHA2 family multidrug resistance protein